MPLDRAWVKKRSPKWNFLKNYLDGKGYTVYPTEIACSTKHCPDPERNFMVDVAAFKNGCYYAFEFKSNGDQLIRAIAQIKNYAVSFDYVIVVAQVNKEGLREVSVDPARGKHMKQLLNAGAGFWTVYFPYDPYNPDRNFIPIMNELVEPKLQNPHAENKKWIINKFKRYVWGIPHPEDPNQKQIKEWLK